MARGGHRSSRSVAGRRSSSSWKLLVGMLLMLSAVILTLLIFGIFAIPDAADSSELHGARRLGGVSMETKNTQIERDDGLGERGEQWTEVLSWEPRAFVYHNFLSKQECEHLISLAKPHMHKSTVVDSATGKSVDSRVRTSSGTFLRRGQDKVVQTIEQRISDFTFLPVEHGEGLQVLHYEAGQKYEPHFDYFLDKFNTKNGGQRMATVLMYLSDVEEGGETIFPNAQVNISLLPHNEEVSSCAKDKLAVKPRMGDALLFWSMRPDATLDPTSLHGMHSHFIRVRLCSIDMDIGGNMDIKYLYEVVADTFYFGIPY